MVLHLSRCEYVINNRYHSRTFSLTVKTSISGYSIDNLSIILSKFSVQYWYEPLCKWNSTDPHTDTSFTTENTLDDSMWMWLLVFVDFERIILVSYNQWKYMLFKSDTTVNLTTWMWTLVSVENAKRILVSYFINLPSSQECNKFVSVTPHVQIRICHKELILQLFILFECD